MVRLRINTDPLLRLGEKLSDPDAHRVGAFRAGEEHVALTQEVFERQGAPLASWPPKQVPSGKIKGPKRRSDPTPRLQDTGALVSSIKHRLTDYGYDIGPDPLPYARIHQEGGQIPISPAMRRRLHAMGFHVRKSKRFIDIPQRQYIGMADEWRKHLLTAYMSAKMQRGLQNG